MDGFQIKSADSESNKELIIGKIYSDYRFILIGDSKTREGLCISIKKEQAMRIIDALKHVFDLYSSEEEREIALNHFEKEPEHNTGE